MLETSLNLLSGPTTLLFAGAALLLYVFAVAVGSVTVKRSELAEDEYRRKAALYPAYESLQAAEAALGEKRRERDELLEELNSLRQEQAEAQRHQLDAQHWQSLAEQAKRDYENRQDLVDEVERLRAAYEDAAKDLAARNEELAELTRKRSELVVEIEAAQKRLDDLEDQRQQVEDLTAQLEELNRRRGELQKELDDIKDQRDERLRAAYEVEQLSRRRAELEEELKSLPEQVKGIAERRDTLRKELEELQRDADRLRDTRNELDRLQERKIGLDTDIGTLEREKDRLEAEVASIGGVVRPAEGELVDDLKKIADLMEPPNCLFGDSDRLLLPETSPEKDEIAMLSRV